MTVVRRKSNSKDLDSFLKAKRSGRLLGSVERHLKARDPEFREWRYLHPSALSKQGWCHRAAWHVVTSETAPPPEKIGRITQSIFDEGHLIHDKWQSYFWQMGNLYGAWRCLVCKHQWWALSPQFCEDIACQSSLLKYAEVPLLHAPWLIGGHADGWVKGIGDDVLIEIKSVGTGTVRYEAPNMFAEYDGNLEAIWKDLKRPFSSHLRQAQLYVRLLHQFRDDAPNEIVFIYECKANQQAKEFPVPYDEHFTDDIIDGALLVKKHIDLGTPPPCPNAPLSGCSECKPYRKTAA